MNPRSVSQDYISYIELEDGVLVSYLFQDGLKIEVVGRDYREAIDELEMAVEHYKAHRYAKI